jgi:Na+-translocating ferredoxin:NAD+ oxidoreductase RnfG subunit
MLKALKIVLTLTVIVVAASAILIGVIDVTDQVIAERKAEEMQEIIESLSDIFPAMQSSYQVEEAESTEAAEAVGITTTLLVTDADGNPKGYVYFVTFSGYANPIEYIISVDSEGNIGGFEFLSMAESASNADEFLTAEVQDQFDGMSIQLVGDGAFDGVSGATFTTGYWKNSMAGLYQYHLDTYGFTPLTPAQVLQAKKEALAGGTLVDYSNANPFGDYGIIDAQVTEDGSVVVYEVEFVGYNVTGLNSYIIALDTTDNTVIGYETLYSDDSTDFGQERLLNTDNWSQFEGLSSADLQDYEVDGFAGVTATGSALEQSLLNVGIYHRWEFEGVKELTPEEQFEVYKEELFPSAETFEDVTAFKDRDLLIRTIFDAKDSDDNLVGTIYHVVSIGASYSETTFIEFLVGIDTNGNFTGFRMVDDTETPGRTDGFYADGYGDTIAGDDITADIGLDGITGSTITYSKIISVIEEVVVYHNEKYIGRPDSVVVDNADLLAAYPTAAQFESVYEDYTYNNLIGNIYEAQDGSGTALGYVYVGSASGYGNDAIQYTWGVALDGTTQQLHIVSTSESWNLANQYADYNGSAGLDFATTSWLDNFEGILISSILTSSVDVVAGVSTSTAGMNTSLETVAEYHQDENVGGGN